MSKCQWCLRRELPRHPKWEQRNVTTGKYEPLCNVCARRRVGNPYNALIDMRKITEASDD